MRRRHPLIDALVFLIALTIILTWPQVLYLGSRVAAHDDTYLSLWRVLWVSHILPTDFRHLFDGNIFYPHARTLAYSDATLLEALFAAPWLWAHTNPVLVYNLLLLTGIVSSGVGMFVLVRYLTGSDDAAVVSAAIFTLVPYRIEHFMHLELQWTVWMPLTLWAVHRVFDTGSIRFGALTGALLSLQLLSCVYYGAFLGIIVAALTVMLVLSQPERAKSVFVPLLVAAVLSLAVAAAYGWPYVQNAREVGTRQPMEVASFSAQLASYVVAPQENWLWGWTAFRFGGNELHLFPGAMAVALSIVAVAWWGRSQGRSRLTWIYLTLVVISVELSRGLNGAVYRWLYGHLWAMHGFRAPARFGILACCALAVLAGIGFERLNEQLHSKRLRAALLVTVLVAVGLEYGSAPMRLNEVSRRVPDVYQMLKTIDRSVLIELPIEDWNLSPVFMFWSTWHWHPLVNGYSGFVPPDYVETQTRMRTFPDEDAIEYLRQLHVRYILVHDSFYAQKDFAEMMLQLLQRPDIISSGIFKDWVGNTHVFELKPAR